MAEFPIEQDSFEKQSCQRAVQVGFVLESLHELKHVLAHVLVRHGVQPQDGFLANQRICVFTIKKFKGGVRFDLQEGEKSNVLGVLREISILDQSYRWPIF